MKLLNRFLIPQLILVLLISSGFTCQKKYPVPPPEKETTADSSESTIEGSQSRTETSPPSESDAKQPVEKSDQ